MRVAPRSARGQSSTESNKTHWRAQLPAERNSTVYCDDGPSELCLSVSSLRTFVLFPVMGAVCED